MKGLVTFFSFVFFLCFLDGAFAQGVLVVHLDSSGKAFTTTSRQIKPASNYKPLVILDGAIYKGELNINADSIFDIKLYTGKAAVALGGSKGLKGVIYAVTKPFAVSQYQKKLSSFSKEYKHYIELEMKYNHRDGVLLYMPISLNDKGEFLTEDERIRALYNLPVENIKRVELNKKETCCGTNVSVNITLKK